MWIRAHSWEHLELLHDPRILNGSRGDLRASGLTNAAERSYSAQAALRFRSMPEQIPDHCERRDHMMVRRPTRFKSWDRIRTGGGFWRSNGETFLSRSPYPGTAARRLVSG